ncbi:MAG: DNA translocase FtsK, partial [Candidatus Vogelbacteria bacterium]|nr:DNA translocase FtsK [Candidatus Vogelbacteria bacterium]
IVGGILFFVSFLGTVNVVFSDNQAGLLGYYASWPFLRYFDYYGSLIFLPAIMVISLIVAFDTHHILGVSLFKKIFGKKEVLEGEGLSAKELASANLAELASADQAEGEKNKAENDAKEADKKNLADGKDKNAGMFGSLLSFGRKMRSGEFVPPPISLLEKDSGKANAGDIKANANIIKRTLANFGITVEMDEISIGPTVTRYALKPAEGVKLSRIVALQNDLALSLAAHPLRIEAPIPGKSLVGIEIPNKVKATIRLASLFSTKEYLESSYPLFVSLGRDISGAPRYANLAKAPHMLIAGATGSGKSVSIHAIINSLLYRNPPDQMRFVMIDPKRVELTLYNKIPHLLTPVITDAKKAISALRWLAKEMDRRFDILEAEAVRDIQSYHKNILEPAMAKPAKKNEAGDEVDDLERMPYIVVIIDELADIMTAYPRELEAAIVRLAQMSRAVGIHLILSTQRPSVEVITGLIKANIPSRVALQVASQIDSRTILDMAGAEKLLGAGDMLYISGEMSKPIRIQSAFISEEEVKRIVTYLAEQYTDILPSGLNLVADDIRKRKKGGSLFSDDFESNDSDDELYEQAREAVIQANKASASYLQRKLKVGYARAARLLDMLEERGVIGQGDGAKAREVFGGGQPSATDGDNADNYLV